MVFDCNWFGIKNEYKMGGLLGIELIKLSNHTLLPTNSFNKKYRTVGSLASHLKLTLVAFECNKKWNHASTPQTM